ncbi:hypothetical protein [Shewanella algicola]|uniref:hypothetical protein n=1 Tax=Shewanella algicola TaxID=640633 RepID=UPI002495188D|nr:hypothetical protein [Shewanella algicola]
MTMMMSMVHSIAIGLMTIFIIVFIRNRIASMTNDVLYKSIGVVGIPIHELSHFIVCLAFMPLGYRVQKLELYKPSNDDTVGYVQYSYQKTFMSPICNLFIGIAPLLGGTLAFGFVTWILMPDVYRFVLDNLVSLNAVEFDLNVFLSNIGTMLGLILSGQQSVIQTLCWLFISYSLIVFSVPSRADLSQSKLGALYLAILLIGLAIVLPGQIFKGIELLNQFNLVYLSIAVLHILFFMLTMAYSGLVTFIRSQ